MHPLMATVLLRMTWRDPLQLDAQAEPPHRELAEAIEGMRGGKRQPVIGSNPSRAAFVRQCAIMSSETSQPSTS